MHFPFFHFQSGELRGRSGDRGLPIGFGHRDTGAFQQRFLFQRAFHHAMARLDVIDEREIPAQCSAKYVHAFSPETSRVFAVTQPCYLDEHWNRGHGGRALALPREFGSEYFLIDFGVMFAQLLKCFARIMMRTASHQLDHVQNRAKFGNAVKAYFFQDIWNGHGATVDVSTRLGDADVGGLRGCHG